MQNLSHPHVISTPAEQADALHGYVDAHVHIKDASRLDDALAAGITALRDAGSRDGSGLRARSSNPQVGKPSILSAGQALYKTGGYGPLLGVPVGTPEDIKKEILRLKNAGAAIIKVIASGLVSLDKPGHITPGGLSRAELVLAVQNAADCGLSVMAHANGAAAVKVAAEAGVRSVEHGFFIDESALEMMAMKGTFWTPTVGALARAARAKTVTRQQVESIDRLIRRHLAMINSAHRAGILLAIGTDSVLPHVEYGSRYREELAYFEQAGISREDVEHIGRRNGAKLLNIVASNK